MESGLRHTHLLTFRCGVAKIQHGLHFVFERKREDMMQVYEVVWECASCGNRQMFRRGFSDADGWPNKFDDLECENSECGQAQDVPFRACTLTPVEGT